MEAGDEQRANEDRNGNNSPFVFKYFHRKENKFKCKLVHNYLTITAKEILIRLISKPPDFLFDKFHSFRLCNLSVRQ